MFKFQFNFLETGEITESDYIYKFPHTAKQGALAFLRNTLKYGDRSPDEKADCKIFSQWVEEPIIYLGGEPMELRRIEQWLMRHFDR